MDGGGEGEDAGVGVGTIGQLVWELECGKSPILTPGQLTAVVYRTRGGYQLIQNGGHSRWLSAANHVELTLMENVDCEAGRKSGLLVYGQV